MVSSCRWGEEGTAELVDTRAVEALALGTRAVEVLDGTRAVDVLVVSRAAELLAGIGWKTTSDI